MINKERLTEFFAAGYDDLENVGRTDDTAEVEKVLAQYRRVVTSTMDLVREEPGEESRVLWFSRLGEMISQVRQVPRSGRILSGGLCEELDLDLLLSSLRSSPAQTGLLVLEVLKTNSSTKDVLVERGLEDLVSLTSDTTRNNRLAAAILENLWDHSEETSGRLIGLGGLETVVEECKSEDLQTLRHCASGLANAALYTDWESQEIMTRDHHVPQWLFTLLVSEDAAIKYFACLAIATLATNKHIETQILETDSFKQIRPILATLKTTTDFSDDFLFGKSDGWLQRLVRVLTSEREESKIMAAFHFAMEAQKRKKEGRAGVFDEVDGALDMLHTVARTPNGVASQYAAQALRTVGEDIPYQLSYQVVTWSPEDVKEWIKQRGFSDFADTFLDNRVDGDILLQISDEMLREDINMNNGLLRKKFLRKECQH